MKRLYISKLITPTAIRNWYHLPSRLRNKKAALLLCLLSFAVPAFSQPFTTVALTGYTADIVADGAQTTLAGVASSVSVPGYNGFDNGGYVFIAQNYSYSGTTPTTPASYLPSTGTITSITVPGLTYQLAPYSGNNALYVPEAVTASPYTISYVTPQAGSVVYLLGTSGGGSIGSALSIAVNFADGGASQTFAVTCPNWFANSSLNTATVGCDYLNIGRMSLTNGTPLSVAPDPELFKMPLVLSAANATRLISSVTITRTDPNNTNDGYFGLFAVSMSIPPVGNTNVTSLSPFGAQLCSSSSSQSFLLTGVNLSPAAGTITATATTGFQVSTDNATWGSSAFIPYSGGNTPAGTAIFVRFSPVFSSGTVSGSITFSGGGVTIPAVAVSGVAAALPATTGPTTVCPGAQITLSNSLTSTAGGTWSSSNTTIASVTSAGVVTGGTVPGIAGISYTLPCGDATTPYQITVSVPPLPINASNVCIGLATTVTDATTGGTWSSNNTFVATIAASGTTATVNGVNTGTTTIIYTSPATGCSAASIVSVNALPALFTVTQTNGNSYCNGTASTIHIGLSNSATGVNYQLMYNGITPIGAAVPGITGSALDFGVQSAAGSYTVVATNLASSCTIGMTGTKTIAVTTAPAVFAVSASNGAVYCTGGAGDSLLLSNSVSGINYKLFSGGATAVDSITGNGSRLNFGVWPAGAYTITGTDATAGHCTSTMTGSPLTITANPLPTAYTVTAGNGGAYCSGTDGTHVGLAFSNVGITYKLYQGSTFIDSVLGSNSGLDFGAQTVTGNYTATAVNATSRCTSNMSGSATVSINYPPVLNVPTGGGSYCAGSAGVPVGIAGSDIGALYQLYNGPAPVGSPVPGTGTGFNFGIFTATGNYTISGVNATTGCKDTMPSSVSINVNAMPVVYTLMGGGNYCMGGIGKDIYLNGSDAGATYWLYDNGTKVDSLTSEDGGLLDFSNFTAAGSYTVSASNGACTANMAGSAVITINPLPNAYTVTGSGGYCADMPGRHVGLSFSDVGVSYQLFNDGSIGSPVAGSGSGLDFGIEPSGTYTVQATDSATGCSSDMTGDAAINVNQLPLAYNVTGGGEYCAGGTGKDIQLAGSDPGASYQLYLGTSPVGAALPGGGEGGSIDFGLDTAAGAYTVVGSFPTGCTTNMTGAALIVIDPLPNVYTLSGGGGYCQGGTGAPDIILGNSEPFISYQLNNDGISQATLPGTGSALDFGSLQDTGHYTVIATDPSTINACMSSMTGAPVVNILPLPDVDTVTGGGEFCLGAGGAAIGLDSSDAAIQYQLFNNGVPTGSPFTGTGSPLSFGLRSAAGTYTVTAVNLGTTCTSAMEGSASIFIDSLPHIDTVTGGGAYCAGTGGVDISLNASDAGVNYHLYNGSILTDTAIGGSALDFGLQTGAGAYTVVAVNATTGCIQNMFSNAVIVVNTVNTYTVIGGGSFCLGGAGVHIGQSGSTPGVSYQLMQDGTPVGSPVTGTGSALDFGLDTLVGPYSVVATNPATGCTGNMAGGASVNINFPPSVYDVTGGGSFCAADTGRHVGLNGSNEGVQYQLYNGATAVGSPVTGTGIPIDFGLVTAAGGYSVTAVNSNGCMSRMTDTATLTVVPLPTAYTVTAENFGNYCAADSGVHIGLASSDASITYKLYRGTALAATLAGTGGALDFGLEAVAGNYTVLASNAGTGCSSNMPGSANVYIIPLPIVHNVTGGGGYCAGGAGVDVGLDGSDAGIYYQLYRSNVPVGSIVYGTGVALNFGIQPAGDYKVVGSSEVVAMGYVTTCPNPMFDSAVVSIDTMAAPIVTLLAYPGTGIGVWHIDSMKVFFTNGGSDPTFQWIINGNIIPGATSSTFTNHVFYNNDSVAVIVTANGACGSVSTTEWLILTLHSTGVTQVTQAGSDIKLVPNPNKGAFTLEGTLGTTADEEVTMEVVNMLGQVVYTNKVMTQGGNIDQHVQLGSSLANGMYIMTLHSATQNSVIHFVIEQ